MSLTTVSIYKLGKGQQHQTYTVISDVATVSNLIFVTKNKFFMKLRFNLTQYLYYELNSPSKIKENSIFLNTDKSCGLQND